MPFVPLDPKEKEAWAKEPCKSPEHNPPAHIVIKKPCKWVCPVCGKETYIYPSKFTLVSPLTTDK